MLPFKRAVSALHINITSAIVVFATMALVKVCYIQFMFLNRSMDDGKFGFSSFAEQWNGRLAMMGFIIGLGTELLTGQGILSQIGLG